MAIPHFCHKSRCEAYQNKSIKLVCKQWIIYEFVYLIIFFNKSENEGFFPNCIDFFVWNYIDGIIQSCTDFKAYAMTGQETFTKSSFTLLNIHRWKVPRSDIRPQLTLCPLFTCSTFKSRVPSLFFHRLSHKQDRTKFWPFLPQSVLPPTNKHTGNICCSCSKRQEEQRGFWEIWRAAEEACVKWGWKWRQWED